jgi:hypothetical protein
MEIIIIILLTILLFVGMYMASCQEIKIDKQISDLSTKEFASRLEPVTHVQYTKSDEERRKKLSKQSEFLSSKFPFLVCLAYLISMLILVLFLFIKIKIN